MTAGEFPSTRYQGSKAKLLPWLASILLPLGARTFLDAFGGTGVVSHRMKREGLRVTYNDALRFNWLFGKALVENPGVTLADEDVEWVLASHERHYPTTVAEHFHGVYFTDEENVWIDRTVTNVLALEDPYKLAIAFYALAQACIVKRPYNLFHRKNLYVRFADVERSFGNKASWDRPFGEWFRRFVAEANAAVLRDEREHVALHGDAVDCPPGADLVYLDPPYVPQRGQGVDYLGFYHFLEGLATYDTWPARIDLKSKHRRLTPHDSPWTDRRRVAGAFEELFARFAGSTIAVSYRSDGVPSPAEIEALLRRHKPNVTVHARGAYQYALSTNKRSEELLFVGR